jgi:biopolymer transport protein ExbD
MPIKSRNEVDVSFNMSSMTDIVFLLLIFFIIASTLISPNGIKILLPKGKGSTEQRKQVSVTIDKNLNYFIDSKKVNKANLESALVSKLDGKHNPGFVLKAEESTDIKYVVEIMEMAAKNKYQVVLAQDPS